MYTIKMEHSKYSIVITDERINQYEIKRCDEDVSDMKNNLVTDLVYEIINLRETIAKLAQDENTTVMTSTIGDLPVNSTGLRTAIDEIARLENKLRSISNIISAK